MSLISTLNRPWQCGYPIVTMTSLLLRKKKHVTLIPVKSNANVTQHTEHITLIIYPQGFLYGKLNMKMCYFASRHRASLLFKKYPPASLQYIHE